MTSIWSASCDFLERPSAPGDLSAEAVVIGGGIAGILTAWLLQQRGMETILVERDRLCSGQTKNTTAKITLQHGLRYDRLLRRFGRESALLYAAAHRRAIDHYRQIVEEEHIDCAFTECASCLYSTLSDQPLRQEAEAAAALGIPAVLSDKTELPFPVAGALRMPRQAQFHPLSFLRPLSDRLAVYEHTPVRLAERRRLVTDRGTISARYVIFATHFPFVNIPGYYFARMHQSRSYVLAVTGVPALQDLYYGIDRGGLSFRSSGPFTLIGGESHRTGENREGGRYDRLRRQAAELWPDSAPAACWSAQDCMTLDGLPYIGPFSPSAPGWYVATGFGKWGMTGAMVAAQLISSLIFGEHPPEAALFSPRRFSLSVSGKRLMSEGAHTACGLASELFSFPKTEIGALPPGHGGVVSVDGRKAGVYKNEEGESLIVSPRCPHMGCQLVWNPDEHSWDCPCHGSRFAADGARLDGPVESDLPHE